MRSTSWLKPQAYAFVVLSLVFSLGNPSVQAADLDSWIQAQTRNSAAAMLGNVGPSANVPDAAPGSVVASPSRDPNYRYHWVRDAALTMDTVLGLYERALHSGNPGESSRDLQLMMEYVDFSRRNQLTPNLSGGAEDLGLGEPKFNLDGSAYLDTWGRPQNDGPALRACTLIRLAHLLLDQGHGDYVREKLYDASGAARTVIQVDLEFVSRHWRDGSFDLWEEVKGKHFYTRMVQRRALLEGAQLADRLGDQTAAEEYRSQARSLEPEISRHWDASQGLIRATLDREGGLDGKASGQDVAVILGSLHGAIRGGSHPDPFFAVTDERVLATAIKLQETFRRLYPINSRDRDSDSQPLGVAIGRYPEDRYSGTANQPTGNPWFLATNAFAELYYRCVQQWSARGSIQVSAPVAAIFRGLRSSVRAGGVAVGETISSGDSRFYPLLRGMRQAGDEFLRRSKYHADLSGALSEQMNRDSGYMQSAEQLTWSHASLLTAVWARGQ